MNETSTRISTLITKFLNNDLDDEGQMELARWKDQSEDNRRLFEKLTSEELLFKAIDESYKREDRIYNKLKENISELSQEETAKVIKMQRFTWRKLTAAAAVILVIAAGAYLWLGPRNDKPVAKKESEENRLAIDKAPGKDGAILQLADGKQIVLDDAANGNLIHQGNTVVIKSDGLVSYNNKEKPNTEVLFNTLTTPRGRQFKLALPDGSLIWLNSSSSIRFPNYFAGNERSVEVTGEVYMEIAKNPSKPFRVLAKGAYVEVLGTHFNIKAYKDEPVVKTTLLEGKVKVLSGKSIALLKPGQQAQITGDQLNVIDGVDMDAAIAWKNGIIAFTQSDIKEILRQVSRWYDVDVVYKGDIKVQELRGRVPRNIPLSDVLTALEMSSGLKFTVEGNKVIVQSK